MEVQIMLKIKCLNRITSSPILVTRRCKKRHFCTLMLLLSAFNSATSSSLSVRRSRIWNISFAIVTNSCTEYNTIKSDAISLNDSIQGKAQQSSEAQCSTTPRRSHAMPRTDPNSPDLRPYVGWEMPVEGELESPTGLNPT